MGSQLIVLTHEDILDLVKEKYPDAEHIELYIDYNDEGVDGNDQIIAEINLTDGIKEADELLGIFNKLEDKGNFILDLEAARDERAESVINKINIPPTSRI